MLLSVKRYAADYKRGWFELLFSNLLLRFKLRYFTVHDLYKIIKLFRFLSNKIIRILDHLLNSTIDMSLKIFHNGYVHILLVRK